MNKLRLIFLAIALAATLVVFRGAEDEQTSERIVRIILVPSREEAEQLLARLGTGESFERLAKQFSKDPTALEGGYLGKVKLEGLRAELREAIRKTPPGQLAPIVQLPAGVMLIEVLEKEQAKAPRNSNAEQAVAYVSGFEEVVHFFSQKVRGTDHQQDLKAICEAKSAVVRSVMQEMETQLTTPNKLGAHHTLAQMWSYQGDMEKTIQHFLAASRIAGETGPPDLKLALEEKLGIALLRKGELENCIHNHNAASCIFPLKRDAIHKLPGSSERAVGYFLKYLQAAPKDLEVRWLLSIAMMTLGKYPAEVPKEYLIPPEAFQSKEDVGTFVDVAPAAGFQGANTAGGVIIDDFDNDGLLDVAISIVDVCQCMRLYRNQGDGTFREVTKEARLSEQLGGINLNQADYNNDGYLDIFVMRGGWEFPMRNSLLRNNGDGTFTDVTAEAGLAAPAYATPTAAWADFDNDGRLDLFVGNENAPGQLFRNQGNGTFKDVAHAAGVDRISFAKAAVWGDYDNDGFPDLYVSNHGQKNFLYHNNRSGGFTEVAAQLGVEGPLFSFPAWFFDYDNDGWLDLFVSSYIRSVAEIAGEYLKLPTTSETLKLYRNDGKGGFEDVTREVGLNRVSMAMGSNFGDIDNDGFLDFYLGTGSPSYGALVPNLMFRNHDGKYFVDVTASSGTGHLQKGHGIAFADIDYDGDQDIFLHSGGAVPGDSYGNALFRNPGHGNNWIGVKLTGKESNRAGIGARIKVTVQGEAGPREIHRVVTSGGSFGSSSLQQHIGLGKGKQVAALEIWWPVSGKRMKFQNVTANQWIEIGESANTFRVLKRQAYALKTAEGHSH